MCFRGAAGLWWRQRDRLYGIFSLAAFFGVLRHVDHISISQPLSWPAWGGVLAVFAGFHLGLVAYFSLLILQKDSPRLDRVIKVVIVTVVALAVLAFGPLLPALWTIAFLLLEVLGFAVFAIVLREAVRTRQLFPWLRAAGALAGGASEAAWCCGSRMTASASNRAPARTAGAWAT